MNKKERYLNCKYLDAGMDGMLCERAPFRTCLEFNGDSCPYYQAKKSNPPKAGTTPSPKKCSCKQRTVLSVRDFAILYNMVNNKIMHMEDQAQTIYYFECDNSERVEKERAEKMERLRQDFYYQDLLRIRDKLGELNIEIETPSVEVEDAD